MTQDIEMSAVASLDFTAIKRKLMRPGARAAWSQARTDAAERDYRRFLYLITLFPNEPMAPTADVDTFWHCHIVDTMKYARDCDHVFGYFLHHYPYLGLNGANDEAVRDRAARRMHELCETTFGPTASGVTGHADYGVPHSSDDETHLAADHDSPPAPATASFCCFVPDSVARSGVPMHH